MRGWEDERMGRGEEGKRGRGEEGKRTGTIGMTWKSGRVEEDESSLKTAGPLLARICNPCPFSKNIYPTLKGKSHKETSGIWNLYARLIPEILPLCKCRLYGQLYGHGLQIRASGVFLYLA